MPKKPNNLRMPHGYAQRILRAMRFGEPLVVRPEYLNALRVVSHRVGVRFIANSYWTATGERRVRITRVALRDWRTGHITQRMPQRDISGQFLLDTVANTEMSRRAL